MGYWRTADLTPCPLRYALALAPQGYALLLGPVGPLSDVGEKRRGSAG